MSTIYFDNNYHSSDDENEDGLKKERKELHLKVRRLKRKLRMDKNICNDCLDFKRTSKEGKKYCPCYFLKNKSKIKKIFKNNKIFYLKKCKNCKDDLELSGSLSYVDLCLTCYRKK